MCVRAALTVLVMGALLPPPALAAQDPTGALPDTTPPLTVLYGRVEDAATGDPLVDAVVSTGDVFGAVATDSSGAFGLPVYGPPPYYLLTEAIGYEPAEYELPADATDKISVLALTRGPIPVEGISVVAQARVTGVLQGLSQRRGSYSGSVRYYDRDRLDRVAGRNAFQLVLQTVSGARECESMYPLYPVSDRICRRPPNRAATSLGNAGPPAIGGNDTGSLTEPDPDIPMLRNPLASTPAVGVLDAGPDEILVCINGRRMFSHDDTLSGIPLEEIAIYEVYGPPVAEWARFAPPSGHVRIYTRIWLLTQASRAAMSFPASWGC